MAQERTRQIVAILRELAESPNDSVRSTASSIEQMITTEIEKLLNQGGALSSGQVEDLENQLKDNPKDSTCRIMLLGYYGSKAVREGGDVRGTWQQHVLKLIEFDPRSLIFSGGAMAVGRRHAVLSPPTDGSAFEEAVKLWQRIVKENGNDAQILGNASLWFLLDGDLDQAATLLSQAQKLEPRNFRWALEIASLYAPYVSNARQLEEDSGLSVFKKALESLEESYTLTEETLKLAVLSNEEREALSSGLQLLGQRIPPIAFAAGENQKANKYATTLLASLPKHKRSWNYGNVIYDANIILGRIALKENRIDAAKHHLLEAGRTPGSPQLNSFGPKMVLAEELLTFFPHICLSFSRNLRSAARSVAVGCCWQAE